MLRIIFSFYNKYETFNRQAKQLFQYIFVQCTIDLIIIFILQILLYFHLVDTAYKTVAQLARGSGGGPPALFIKIVQTLVEKSALFVFIYGFNTHLKCSFKSISEKKHQIFLCGAFLLYVIRLTFMKVALFQETSPAPKNPQLRSYKAKGNTNKRHDTQTYIKFIKHKFIVNLFSC